MQNSFGNKMGKISDRFGNALNLQKIQEHFGKDFWLDLGTFQVYENNFGLIFGAL